MIVRHAALALAALALAACSSDPAAPADSGAPMDTGADAGGTAPDAGAGTTDAGGADTGMPPACNVQGGEACFALPTAALTANAGAGMAAIAPDFDCDLAAVTTAASALPISGVVEDFVSSEPVANATVDVFSGVDYLGAPLATAMSNAMGQYTVTVPAGTRGPLAWRVRAAGTLDTYLVNDTANLARAAVMGSDRNSVDTGTASLLATLLGQSRRPMTGILAGEATDCRGRALTHAVATLSSTSSRGTNGRPAFVPGAQVYYFSPTPQLPTRRASYSATSVNGLYLAIQVPPSMTATYYTQLWGFRAAADVARGAAGLSLISETAVKVLPDVLVTVEHEALRAP